MPAGPRYQSGTVRIGPGARLGETLAAALEPLGLGVLVAEARTLRVIFASEGIGALLGCAPGELLAAPSLLARVAPEDVTSIAQRLADAEATPFALRLLHALGHAVDVEVSARACDERSGRSIALVVRGLEERREREALQRALDEASAALRARDDMIAMASHELRTPLTSLRLHVQAVNRAVRRELPDVTRARRSIAEVERHAERLSRLLDQLLDAAHVRSGKLIIDRAPVDLGAVVRDVAARFAAEAARGGSTIIVDGERSVHGHWDPFRLDQVVTNLLSNALKYGSGSPVSLELVSTPGRAILSIRDHGPGIAPEEHGRIFEAFERVSSDARVRGAGLGLWIVRRLVEAHGGSVFVLSSPGRGAQFVIDLPCQPERLEG